MSLNGTLDDYSPAGALRVLSSTGKTGAVRFSGDAGCTVYLHRGELYFARDDDTDEALATALVRPGRLSAEHWAQAIDQAGSQPRLGEVLVELGAIDSDLLASVVLSVVYDPLIRLFREADGRFDFEPDTVHWIGPFRTFNVEAIVAEVRRRVREADEMSPVVPSLEAWVSVQRTLPGGASQVTLLREDWELVAALRSARTVSELATDLGRGKYSTARVVHRLANAGLVEVSPEALSPYEAPHEPSLEERLRTAVVSASTEPSSGEHGAAGAPSPASAPTATAPGPAPTTEEEPDAGEEFTFADFDAPAVPSSPVDAPGLEDEPLLPKRAGSETSAGGFAAISGFRSSVGNGEAKTTSAGAPNDTWLQDLYAHFLDDPEAGHSRSKEAMEIAFGAEEQDHGAKVGTLRRLLGALKKI